MKFEALWKQVVIGNFFYRAMALVAPLTLSSQLPDNANGLIPVLDSDSRGFTLYSAPIVCKESAYSLHVHTGTYRRSLAMASM